MISAAPAAPVSASTPAPTPVRDAPAFDFYPERWLVGVASLSDAEQIAYLRLLCHQWLLGDAGLPAEEGALRRLAGKGVTPALLAKFPPGADGRLRNRRLEIVRAAQRQRIQEASRKGRRMAEGRWKDKRVPQPGPAGQAAAAAAGAGGTADAAAAAAAADADACALLKQSMGNAHQSPPTDHPPEKERESAPQAREGGFPSLAEVKAYAPTVMAPEDCAESFWNDCEGSGWVNRHGQPIADWRPLFRNFATIWKSKLKNPNAAHRPPPARSDTANTPGRYA